MTNKIYYNPSVAPSMLRPSKPPKNESQPIYYSNHLANTLKKLEASQDETRRDVSELKSLTHHVSNQLKEFKTKALNLLSNLGFGQRQAESQQEHANSQVLEVKKELEEIKTWIKEFKKEQGQFLETKFESITKDIKDVKTDETQALANMLQSNDLQGLLLEEISKKQALTDNKLTDDLVEIKELISTLTSHSQEHNDIQLEYQKLHERLLHKIVEKQVELEEVR